ncbi:hypothetical protein K469DRAFT_631511 [Zopfia rhizophila CBS 207.26]|uniref:Xylanolytic transcriptional activator regulatory domain-containing protein n=1 Tax=Zopfia rhizophila CBS 207.26 TaxID=1314779 RepID=A0A6A6E8H1_9PEZI|nr:hypothetical protein K469DRAFT_631511 [Zopfia rhizophila CBS 207.26]
MSLLKDLSLRVDEGDKKKIDDTLKAVGFHHSELITMAGPWKVEDEVATPTASTSTNALGKRPRKESSSDEEGGDAHNLGEAQAPASVGSNEDMDLLDEDLLRSRESRETGFVGQNSEVQWLRSLQRQMRNVDGEPLGLPNGPTGASNAAVTQRIDALHERRKSSKLRNILHVADSSFYLDSDSIEVEAMVDPYELPPSDTAERLFCCYMETVHGWFPIIPKAFEDQFRKYYESIKLQRPFQVPDKWQAVLNLVFAIGARYSHLTNAKWQADDRDHLLYMTRAVRILGVKNTTMIISAPDLSLIQATGLLSFYYLVIGHVSRAWVMIGISLRFALAVGLHLRNEDPSAPTNKKETLVRTWWSLHSVECLLSAITGRPCIIANEDCTVPLPQVLPEEQIRHTPSGGQSRIRNDYITPSETSPSTGSSTSEFFKRMELPAIAGPFLDAHIKIGLTTRKVLKGLYSARTANVSWERIQKLITVLMTELEEWETEVLSGGSGSTNLNLETNFQREQFLLRFHYNSTKILITRPCLCRLERRIKGQSDGSANFNQRMAEACVQAAQSLTLLLPDQPNPVYIYQKGPWWSIIHNIMQAMAVFLLEMSYQGTHMTTRDSEDIPKCIKKLVRWLRSMRINNAVAERAYKVVMDILKSGEPRVQTGITDLLADDEADIDRGHLFQAYPVSTHPFDPVNVSVQSEWQADYYRDPSTATFDLMPGLYFLPDQFQMPSAYGNPFLTYFDQPNPISLTMDELWRNEEASPEYSQNQQQ